MRKALIKDGKIVNVILADDAFIARADPRWLAQFDEVRDVTDDPLAEPGATIDSKTRAVRRAERVVERSRDELLEERIAALEARGAGAR
jgi:hypothetical protein